MPDRAWAGFQRWRDVLFAHWPLPPAVLRSHVPEPLQIDTYDGQAWLALTPFRIEAARPRYGPPVPGLSSFPEMNLRTYVRAADQPGIFFFTLDTTSALAVLGARALYRLPYRRAHMQLRTDDGWIHYHSHRPSGRSEFSARYRPTGAAFRASPGTLEHFLIERYALFQVLKRGAILRGDIHHPPWLLHSAEVAVQRNDVPAAHGFSGLPATPPVAHFAPRQDTLIWLPAIDHG